MKAARGLFAPRLQPVPSSPLEAVFMAASISASYHAKMLYPSQSKSRAAVR
jgi:hypothetical protein